MRNSLKTAALAATTAGAFVALAVPGAARAEAVYGSSAILTNRTCNVAANQICVNGPRTFTQYAGGMNTGFATSASNMNGQGASAAAAVEFNDSYLPIMHTGSWSGAATRTGSSLAAFRTYTYSGAQSINLALGGLMDFTASGDFVAGDAYGEGGINVTMAIVPVSLLAEFTATTTAQDIVNSQTIFADCSTGAIGFSWYNSQGAAPGAHSQSVGLSQTCGGDAITLNNGDSFGIIVTLQSISNRGGFADAMHTFKVDYDLEKTVFTNSGQAVGASYLAQAIDSTPVPEPATWAMMIMGFGMIGAAMRRSARGTCPATGRLARTGYDVTETIV